MALDKVLKLRRAAESSPHARTFRGVAGKAAERVSGLDTDRLGKQLAKLFADSVERAQDRVGGIDTRKLRKRTIGRIDEVDADKLGKQAGRLIAEWVETAQSRIRPRRRRRISTGVMLAAGAIFGAGLVYILSRSRSDDLKRLRSQARQTLPEVGRRIPEVGRRIPEVVSKATNTLDQMRSGRRNGELDQAAISSRVESAVHSAPGAEQIEIGVEGRTVYLRGTAADSAVLDIAIERAQATEGVAAVINLAVVAPSRATSKSG